jgi:hypothetical protein
MHLEKPVINDSASDQDAGYTNKLTKDELDKIDPVSKKTWRELVYGVSKKKLKDVVKEKEPNGKKKNIFGRLFPGKKEKKKVSEEDALKIIHFYHELEAKLHSFLPEYSQKYFPNLEPDMAQAQMELVAIQMLMRSQDPASVDTIKDILKKEENYIEIGGERKKLSDILFPKKHGKNEKDEDGDLNTISVSPNIAIATKDPEFLAFLEKNENDEDPDAVPISHGTAGAGKDWDSDSSAEKKRKSEMSTDEALKVIRDYFDMQAKMYGMLDAKVDKLFPNIGKRVEENRIAILAIENYLNLHDEVSLKAIERILKNEKKYIKENKETPLAELFFRIKPQIEAIF